MFHVKHYNGLWKIKEDTMIKIFATDMDHTLLDNDSNLPENIASLINEITDKNKIFIAASGRTLTNLHRKYKDIDAKITFISDNGAILEHDGEIQYINKIKEEDVIDTIHKLRHAEDSTLVIITPTMSYIESDNENHHKFLREYYTHMTLVDDLMDYTEDVIKITMVSPTKSHSNFIKYVDGKLSDNIYGVEAGKVWIDIMNRGINKAVALKHLMDIIGVTEEHLVTFGDYYNDLEMIKLAKYGFAVENAPQDIKDVAYGVIGSNHEQAVYHKIKEILDEENNQ